MAASLRESYQHPTSNFIQVDLVQNFHASQVVAKNRVGETNMDTRLEVVTEEPGFITPLKDCQTKLGNTETFECVVKVSKQVQR